jgi:UDP-3-O-acyl N-acetylglucosamine deacetylase
LLTEVDKDSPATSAPTLRATLAAPAATEGRGVHGGEWCHLGFHPAAAGAGIAFQRTDLPGQPVVPATLDHLVSDSLLRRTTLEAGGARVYTSEHIVSAAYGGGITDLLVTMDQPEPPFLDGSALPFTEMIRNAGVASSNSNAPLLKIEKPLVFRADGCEINVLPSDHFQVSYFYNSDHPKLRAQCHSCIITPESYRAEIASARTFCFFDEIEGLRRANLIKGANLSSAVVIGKKGILNDSLRFPDEPTRHKILDFIGDLALLGFRFQGHFLAWKSGHRINAEFAKHLKKEFNL